MTLSIDRQDLHTLRSICVVMLVGILLTCALIGCGKKDSGPTAADVVRRQQLREAAAAAQPKSLDERMKVVRDYLENHNSTAAAAALRPLLISDGSNPDVVILTAHAEAAQGHLAEAATMLVEQVSADPKTMIPTAFLAAEWFAKAGQTTQAAEPLEKLLDQHAGALTLADSTRAHRQLAEQYNVAGRRLEAAPHLQWLARNGQSREMELFAMIAYGDPFINTVSPAIDRSMPDTQASLVRAKVLRHEAKLTEAKAWVEALAARFPESAAIAAFRGRIYADLHDVEKLVQWHSELPAGIEEEPEYWFAAGVLMNQQLHPKEAVRCFLEAVQLDPTDRFSYLELSRTFTSLGHDDVAECARQKFEWLSDSIRLGYSFGKHAGTQAELNRMADLLRDLHRDAESIGWRLLALERFGGSPSEIGELVAQRSSLPPISNLTTGLGSNSTAEAEPDTAVPDQSDELFVTCGLKISAWPSPAELSGDTRDSAVEPARSTAPTASVRSPIQLVDIAAEIGIDFQYLNGADMASERVLLHQLTGGGIGVIDIDRDGWPDLYLTQAGGDAFDAQGSQPNRLLRNLGGQRYLDVTSFTQTGDRGYGQGVAVADLNQDGFADLVVANIGPNRVYINQGDGTFQERELPAWQVDSQWTTSIACGDLTGDGLPEIVEVNYVDDPASLTNFCTPNNAFCNPSNFEPAYDRIWQVRSDGRIIAGDALRSKNVKPGYGFAAIIANTDGRIGNELLVANDSVANHFWLSQPVADSVTATDENVDAAGKFRLIESAQLRGCATGLLGQHQGCMGIASGDFDRNGRIDFHITNFWDQPADLYLQDTRGFFVHSSVNRGLDETTKHTVAWGTQAVDFDRDGWLDLAVLNGHVVNRHRPSQPYQMRPQLFAGGGNGFQLLTPGELASSTHANDNYWNRETLGRTMAVLDWNGDLKPDLICNHLDARTALLENRTAGGNGLQIELVGTESERDAIATEVTVVCGRDRFTSWRVGGHGFLCSNEPLLDFGLGSHGKIDEVLVKWPSGAQQSFSGIVPNQRYLLMENEEQPFYQTSGEFSPSTIK